MDKKRIILTVLSMIGVITLALLLVVFSNQELLKKKTNKTEVTEREIEVKVSSDGRVIGTSLSAFLNDDDFFDKQEPVVNEDSDSSIEDIMEFVESEELVSIDFLIHTADEINELEEDALAKDRAALADMIDKDETENDKLMTGNAVVLGIDVSGWNGDIDWEKVKAAGIKFVIIRCGYRGYGSGCLVEDSYFQQNLKGAKEAGINVGIYFFSQAIDETEAREEAKTAVSLLNGTEIEYPIFIDTEASGGNGRADNLDVDTRTLVCKSFCEEIADLGYKAGVYASCNWYKTKVEYNRLDDYVIWLAEYRSTPQFGEYYDMWQYTSKGNISGISGNVDLNVSYLGY